MTANFITKASLIISISFLSIYSCNGNIEKNLFGESESSITDSIVVTNQLDSNTIQDSINQTLNEVNSNIPLKNPIDSTKKYIYLTFDDGPYKGSKQINQITKDENIKATVFIVGLNAYTKNLKQLINDYNHNDLIEVSNHTYSHANRNKFKGYYSNPEQVLADVIKNDTFFNLTSKFVRLPGRNTWRVGETKKNDYDTGSKNTSDLLANNNYYILGWDYEWNKISKNHPLDHPEKIYNGIMYRLNNNLTLTKNHLVLLMHDDMFDKDSNAEKLRALIKMLQNDPDIIFETASNYPIKLQ